MFFEPEKYLFKFTKLDKFTIYNLLNGEIHFSYPKDLNDPIDCKPLFAIDNYRELSDEDILPILQRDPIFSLSTGYLRAQIARDILKHPDNVNEFINRDSYNSFNPKIRICSFSIDKKQKAKSQIATEQLMWSHYADSSKGICIVFNKESLESRLRVNANSADSSTGFNWIYGSSVKYRKENLPLSAKLKNGEIIFNKAHYLHKSLSWSYEKEYRLIMFIEKLPYNIEKHDLSNAKLMNDKPEYIIMGERTTQQDYSTMQSLFKRTILFCRRSKDNSLEIRK